MEISEFKEKILREIGNISYGDESKEKFLEFVSQLFVDAEEIEDNIFYTPYSARISRKQIQIDGYYYNELSDVLNLYIIPDLSLDGDIETLTMKDAESHHKWAKAFIEEASNILIEEDDDNTPAYGLASDIVKSYSSEVAKYKVIILTDREMSKNIKIIENESIGTVPVEYHIWDISRLMQLFNSRNGKEEVVIKCNNFTNDNELGIPCIPASKTSDYTAYLCNIQGFMLAKLYNQFEGRLLEGNVRSYLQARGKVNQGIINTILNEPEMFFAYNNGIAATARSIKTDEVNGTMYITEIEGLQIVNGGQTTASLALTMIKNKRDDIESKLRQISVPMKLSVVKSHEKSQQIIQDISKYANSQNKVSEADLWSNHPFHIRMEDFSRRMIAPAVNGNQYGTHWFYERANGQYKQATYKATDASKKAFEKQNPKNQMFTKTDLSKYMNIILGRPHTASAGNQKAFAIYAKEISEQWKKDNTVFNEDYFKKVVASVILYRGAQEIVKKQGFNSYKANIVAYTLSKIIETVKEDYPEKRIDYRAIWQAQVLPEFWRNQIENITHRVDNFLESDDRSIANVTEWAKKEACWTRAKRDIYITLLPEFVKALISENEAKSREKESKFERKIDNSIDTMTFVCKYGWQNWEKLIAWNRSNNVLTETEISLINVAVKMRLGYFPSDAQCARLYQILERAKSEGFPG